MKKHGICFKLELALIVFVLLITPVITGCEKIEFEEKANEQPTVSTGNKLELSNEINLNRFGFLTGHPEAVEFVEKSGAKWARPHVGPFLWEGIQESEDADYDFSWTDDSVVKHQESNIGMMITLWPFADWDQKNRENAEECMVDDIDEFLPDSQDKKHAGNYLPWYRCNPYDWEAYLAWVKAVVERYDGDGENDMQGLKYPIKHWEVSNEPDLQWHDEFDEIDTLNFYKQEPEDYAELLIKTSKAIKEANPEAKILISGAAGSNDNTLEFYSRVFDVENSIESFDIANVHCISSGDINTFNVAQYKKLLEEYNINKPIWVTEADSIVSNDIDINATQTYYSSKGALDAGAEKIFFTMFEFKSHDKKKFFHPDYEDLEPELDGSDPERAYLYIINKLK